MRGKNFLGILLTLMLLIGTIMVALPVQASPSPVTFSVLPELYDGTKTVGTKFWVNIYVNASELTFNGADGIIGWGLYLSVDPTVLKPFLYDGAVSGYFLYDFAKDFWYNSPVLAAAINPEEGFADVAEGIPPGAPSPPAGGAATPLRGTEPYLLVSIAFEVLKEAYSIIDIWNAEYKDWSGVWHPVVDEDGHFYSLPPEYGAIDGYVTDINTGAALFGATVTADGYSATTDSNGYYIITDVPAGTYTVTAEAVGYYSETKLNIVVEAGVTTTVDFALVPIPQIGWIEGTVIDSSTLAPIAGASVTADGFSDVTDISGAYSIEVSAPAIYTVTASMAGYYDGVVTDVSVAVQETVVGVDFALVPIVPPGAIEGTVVNADTLAPIAGATVTADTIYSNITDTNGYYIITDVPPGTYDVTASAPEYYSDTKTITVESGVTTTVDFLLTPKPIEEVPQLWIRTHGANIWPEWHMGNITQTQTLYANITNTGAGGAWIYVKFVVYSPVYGFSKHTFNSTEAWIEPGTKDVPSYATVSASFMPWEEGLPPSKYFIVGMLYYRLSPTEDWAEWSDVQDIYGGEGVSALPKVYFKVHREYKAAKKGSTSTESTLVEVSFAESSVSEETGASMDVSSNEEPTVETYADAKPVKTEMWAADAQRGRKSRET